MNLRNWAAVLLIAALAAGYYFISALDVSGMEKDEISARELGFWKVYGAADVQVKSNGLFQIDEKKAGEGVIIESLNDFDGDWVLSFESMLLSPSASLSAKFYDGDEDYTFNIHTEALNLARGIFRNGEDLSQSEDMSLPEAVKRLDFMASMLRNKMVLNKFYKTDIAKRGNKLSIFIDGCRIATIEDKQPLDRGKLSLKIIGLKNHAAGILIRNAAIYTAEAKN